MVWWKKEYSCMEIRVLKYFLMAAWEENIARAADLLHLIQSPLSRQLIQLEEEPGVTLFGRSKHRITLTEDGIRRASSGALGWGSSASDGLCPFQEAGGICRRSKRQGA